MRPLRQTYIQKPMKMPRGIVMAMVKVPQMLSARALTTLMPRPAMATIRMNRMAMEATMPAEGEISIVTISASDFPPRLVEAHRIIESWTAPASTTPATSQIRPGA